MYNLRTDLAVESVYTHMGEGIEQTEEKNGDAVITTVKITDENAAARVNKPIGTYVTIESDYILNNDTEKSKKLSEVLSQQLSKFFEKYFSSVPTEKKILICGLGNRNITADALGPDSVKGLMITNHIIDILNSQEKCFSSVSAITPGVMGITGIETNNIIKGIKDEYKPDVIIAIDALCARSLERMFGTIQITDTGINPGSGVGNKREGINKKTMGIPVIAIGVPTVVDANSIAYDALKDTQKHTNGEISNILESMQSYFVSPKDIDSLIEKSAKIIANGINLSLHKDIDFSFIENYIA